MVVFSSPKSFPKKGLGEKNFVSAVVTAFNGKILCQLRDDIPEIIHPGLWTSAPGGAVKAEESVLDAISREMNEEFNILIMDVEPLVSFKMEGQFAGEYYIFSANLASPLAEVYCNEGQRAAFFSLSEALKLNQATLVQNILLKHIARFDLNEDSI
jgi:8-oxo-dGTP pyrophosphatase MutT (NUDIX family)